MEHFVQAIASLIAIANPVGAAPLFLSTVAGQSLPERRRTALRRSIYVLLILTAATLAGSMVLRFFGLALPALQAAGGLVIGLMGLEMMRGQRTQVQHDPGHGDDEDPALVPHAMPLIAGPGAISTVITLTAHSASWRSTLDVIAVAVVLAVLLLATLFASTHLQRVFSGRGRRVFLRFMGLVLVTIGTQLLLTGIGDFYSL